MGIDLEKLKEKTLKIAPRFMEVKHLENLSVSDQIEKATVIWGVKESIFKIKNEKGISFKDDIQVAPFELNQTQTIADLNFNGAKQKFTILFSELDTNFTLVYAFENIGTIQEH